MFGSNELLVDELVVGEFAGRWRVDFYGRGPVLVPKLALPEGQP